METLTSNQKEFILNFFEEKNCPGWKTIAEKLLSAGQCIVAGEDRIWNGGIGNFIKVDPAKDSYKCSVYTFDLESFLSSEWFEQAKDFEILTLNAKIEISKSKLEDISKLNKRYLNMKNKSMQRKLASGEAYDLKNCKRLERKDSTDSFYIIEKEWSSISDLDFCDSSTESWIWSVGRRKSDGMILASLGADLYQNPDFECLWLR